MIYFDNASTTKISDEVLEKMYGFMKTGFANPSSLHSLGFEVEKEITKARKSIASAIKANIDEIYFTSGGTEANNTAILGVADAYKKRGNRVVTMRIEHPSVTDSYKELEKRGFDVVTLDVDEKGYINIDELENAVDENTILVSIMYVNNEVGTVQDMERIYSVIKDKNKNCIFHTDCVQAFGKHTINCKNADIITMSGHKIQSAKGVGAMYIKKGVRVNNLHFGGGQEKGFRPGTENSYAIVAMGEAAEIAVKNMESNFKSVSDVRNTLLKITEELEGVYINGDREKGSPYIVNLSFENVKGEVLLHALENEDIYVATGSACSSRAKEKKKIVDYIIDGRGGSAVRFSFCSDNTVEEAEKVVECLKKQVPLLRRFVPR
ncbi:MAG: cysteine desulfurase family protein [Clostridia bacterium]|nr:cysteine desulfurase family protein [Clostridia bacterium]